MCSIWIGWPVHYSLVYEYNNFAANAPTRPYVSRTVNRYSRLRPSLASSRSHNLRRVKFDEISGNVRAVYSKRLWVERINTRAKTSSLKTLTHLPGDSRLYEAPEISARASFMLRSVFYLRSRDRKVRKCTDFDPNDSRRV